jgi:Protein of unknown function (DUF2723)
VGACVAFLLALGVYYYTLAPGVIWGDSASLAVQVHEDEFFFGTAGDHPLFVLLGHAFAWLPGELARNLNLLSACCAALAVGVVFLAGQALASSVLAGAVAAGALTFSHAFWLHAVITEVYTLNALAVALVILAAHEWHRGGARVWLLTSFLIFAVGITNHLVLATLVVPLAWLMAASRPAFFRDVRKLGGIGALLATGALVAAVSPGIRTTLGRLFEGPPPIWHYFAFPADPAGLARECGYYLLYLVYQFPGVGVLLGAVGIVHLWRTQRRFAVFLLLVQGVNAFVFLKVTGWTSLGSTKYTFYIQDYVVFSLFVGAGAAAAAARFPACRHLLLPAVVILPIVTYELTPRVVSRAGIDLLGARDLPYRDNDWFFLHPSKRGVDGPEGYLNEVFRVVKPEGAVVADFTLFSILNYGQRVQGRRRDIVLVKSSDFDQQRDIGPIVSGRVPRRSVYVCGSDPRYYNVESISGKYRLVPVASLLEIVELRPESVGN